jgi:hypothetical protein
MVALRSHYTKPFEGLTSYPFVMCAQSSTSGFPVRTIGPVGLTWNVGGALLADELVILGVGTNPKPE